MVSVIFASRAASVTGYCLHYQCIRTSHCWRESLDYSKKLPSRRLLDFLQVGTGQCLCCTVYMYLMLVLNIASQLYYHRGGTGWAIWLQRQQIFALKPSYLAIDVAKNHWAYVQDARLVKRLPRLFLPRLHVIGEL